jgi:histidinol phosphatase-like enzyme (inositol monophosphatase family)
MTDTIDTDQLSELMGFAHQLADAAARATLPLFRNLESVENKLSHGFDPVTPADRDAETAIRALIENHYPSHAITGEEFANKSGDAFEWVIDPIDGTRAFMSGIPTWGTLIGLNFEGQPVLGLLDQPFTQERFFAAQGQGAQLRHIEIQTPIATRACATLDNAVLATTSPDLFTDTPGDALWQKVCGQAKLTRYGGDCYNYALLALGQVDLVMEQGLKDVDIQPLIKIVEEAGGIVTDWQGGPAHAGGTAIACGDKSLHEKLLALLAS